MFGVVLGAALCLAISAAAGNKHNSQVQSKVDAAGEPVPGAEVYIELEPDDVAIAHVVTDSGGVFNVTLPPRAPQKGTLKLTISPPNNGGKFGTEKQVVLVTYDTHNKKNITYTLTWNTPAHQGKAQGKGSFAVSGKSAN
jgi:hypothetical protein